MAEPVAAVVAKQADLQRLISRAVTNAKKLEVKKRTPEAIQKFFLTGKNFNLTTKCSRC